MLSDVLELHVWGPAFGLASIDPECLATIAYLSAHAKDSTWSWRPVASSPSAVPSNTLPSLHDPLTNKWYTGLDAIAALLRPSIPTPSQQATTTAWSSYLASHASPLLALSLYASNANWTAQTRPAYSRILPFPLAWTEPPRVRDEMLAHAEGLGFEGLDLDTQEEEGSEERRAAAGLLKIPQTLLRRSDKSVTGALSPEARALMRLRAEASEVLDALDTVLPLLEGDPRDQRQQVAVPSAELKSVLTCRLYAYLALMYTPVLPRPWLRDLMNAKYPHFCELVHSAPVRFSLGKLPYTYSDPHSGTHPSASGLNIAARFARGALRYAPGGFGEEWYRWALRKRRQGGSGWGVTAAEAVAFVCAAATGAALVAGAWWYKSLMPFGLPVMRFEGERARRGLRGLGSAGTMLAFEDDVAIRPLPSAIGPEGTGTGWPDYGIVRYPQV